LLKQDETTKVELKNIEANKSNRNYVLWPTCPRYDPPGETRDEVFINETPHEYIRDHFEEAYGRKP
jgi:hypothetical protein